MFLLLLLMEGEDKAVLWVLLLAALMPELVAGTAVLRDLHVAVVAVALVDMQAMAGLEVMGHMVLVAVAALVFSVRDAAALAGPQLLAHMGQVAQAGAGAAGQGVVAVAQAMVAAVVLGVQLVGQVLHIPAMAGLAGLMVAEEDLQFTVMCHAVQAKVGLQKPEA